jgi:hypothetical protein
MGFFKKIGTAVKKGVKQVSLKNIVKVGTPLLSMIPVVGGLAENVVSGISAAHQAKKDAKVAQAEAVQLQQQALLSSAMSDPIVAQAQQAQATQKFAEAKQLNQQADTIAASGGAQVGQQFGAQLNAFTKGMTNEALAQTSKGFNDDIGLVGAKMADNTISQWLKLHWQTVLLVGGGLIGLIFFMRKKETSRGRK